jgi:hypothetical protein
MTKNYRTFYFEKLLLLASALVSAGKNSSLLTHEIEYFLRENKKNLSFEIEQKWKKIPKNVNKFASSIIETQHKTITSK